MITRSSYRPRHAQGARPSAPMRQAATAALIASSLTVALGTGSAWAVPEQGGTTTPDAVGPQDGVTPPSSPEQGGTTPIAPPPQTEVVPGTPGLAPAPPSGPVETAPSTPPTYYTPYPNTIPDLGSAPKPTPPQPRRAWKPDHLTIGNLEVPVDELPKELQDNPRAIVSANDWSAWAESEIARGLISMGVPSDEASRRAASAVMGAVAGGAVGFGVGFTATALTVGPVLIPLTTLVGTGIGALVGTPLLPPYAPPVSTLNGAGIGALAGLGVGAAVTVGAAGAVGAAAGITGAIIGGVLADALGAGDPGAFPQRPDLPWEAAPESHSPKNREGNQFELRISAETAQKTGLAPMDYVVTQRGDVEIAGSIGGHSVSAGWSAEQAQAPLDALGPAKPLADSAIRDATAAATKALRTIVPGIEVTWPSMR